MFDSGLSLDSDFDLEIDTTGDVASETGIDDIAKDIRTIVKSVADTYQGMNLTSNDRHKFESKVVGNILDDPRVLEADAVAVTGRRMNTLEVEIFVLTSIGIIEDVQRFDVGE